MNAATVEVLEIGAEIASRPRDDDAPPRFYRPAQPIALSPTEARRPVQASEVGGKGKRGPCFPNFGGAPNEPIAGAPLEVLRGYKLALEHSLSSREKAHFHSRDRVTLAAIEIEILRQSRGVR